MRELTALLRSAVATLLSILLVITTMLCDFASAAEASENYARLSDSDLDALVAPIALYPDALVAQVLGAATYPDQIVDADQYLKENPNLTGDALKALVETSTWDPSVQALTQFPSVLNQLAKNITWASALGDASANQQADILAAIQRMRAKAYAAGNLKSGEQIKVVQQSPQVIVIESAKPQVVYVPTYNPTVVYGTPVVTQGYSSGDVAAAAIISFGVGVAVGALINGSSCASYASWGMNWSVRTVHCGGHPYYGNPYWWGGYYPGYGPGHRPPYYPPPRPGGPPPPGWRPPHQPGGGGHPPGGGPPRPPSGTAPPGNRPGNPGGNRPGAGSPGGGNPSGRPGAGNPGGGNAGGNRPGGNPGGPSSPGSGRPPSTLPPASPAGGRPGNTATGTRPSAPSARPAGTAQPQQSGSRELRGYGNAAAQPTQRPNAFSGSGGGRQQSARGNQSLSGGGARAGGGRR